MYLENTDNRFAYVAGLLIEQNLPFAAYRLPDEDKIYLLIQYKSLPERLPAIHELGDDSGFVIAPFIDEGTGGIFLMKPDIQCDSGCIDGDLPELIKACNSYKQIAFPENTTSATDRNVFTSSVLSATKAIARGDFSKVILSRTKIEPVADDFDIVRTFKTLCDTYPHALTYLWQIPGVGRWMGATPEPVMLEKGGRVSTVSLAGTQLADPDVPLSDVRWGEKEIAEQAVVSRFIVQLFDKLGIDDFDIRGPHNFQAGNLIHLNTGFEFNTSDLHVPFGTFVEALHPTPSIAGLPRNETIRFIAGAEKHSRSYYAGLVGPYRLREATHLYVNLRCVQLFEEELVLYSGAGITINSDPEKEWEETGNKLMTILKVIHVQAES